MKRLLTVCLVLAAMMTASWVSTSQAHWRRGVTVHVGPRYAGGFYGHGYGYGYAPRYYGGYYSSYPVYTTTYYGAAPAYGYYGGGYYGGGYCGW